MIILEQKLVNSFKQHEARVWSSREEKEGKRIWLEYNYLHYLSFSHRMMGKKSFRLEWLDKRTKEKLQGFSSVEVEEQLNNNTSKKSNIYWWCLYSLAGEEKDDSRIDSARGRFKRDRDKQILWVGRVDRVSVWSHLISYFLFLFSTNQQFHHDKLLQSVAIMNIKVCHSSSTLVVLSYD